jgi:S1-C subfamily serine protease
VLWAPDIGRDPLPIGDTDVGGRGGVFGHPGGGTLRIAPFAVGQEITAVGRDIYGADRSRRDVLVLSSSLAPGDSGAALVDPGGAVVGVAFAIAPDRPGVAYALTTGELQAVLADGAAAGADAGDCVA